MRERAPDDFWLLVDFFRHVMTIIALVDEERAGLQRLSFPRDFLTAGVVKGRLFARERDPIVFLEIGDRMGERRERQSVGAKIDAAVAKADGKGRAAPRADEQSVFALEQEHESKRAFQSRKRRGDRLLRPRAPAHRIFDEMDDGL